MREPTSAWYQLSSDTAQVLFCDLQVDIVKLSKTTNPRALASAAGFDTVLDALAHGYQVLVAVDACGSPSPRAEAAVLRQMEAAGATTTSVVSIGTKLSPNFSTERGKHMFAIVQGIKVDRTH